MLQQRYFQFASLLAVIFTVPALAAEDWSLCRIPAFVYAAAEDLAGAETRIEAQSIASEDRDQIRFTGAVSVARATQKISADELFVDKTTEALRANGNVVFESPEYRLQSPAISVDRRNDRARFDQPVFELRSQHARGQAQSIEQLDASRSRFDQLSYTSCDPGDRSWHFEADRLVIDDEVGRGTATGTTLYFQELPFLYLPWFQFPIDERRLSGLLTPRFGYAQDQGGSLVLPVYWNLAANYDMTITPAWYDKLGLQLNTENRYLFSSQQGQIELSYLEDDLLSDSRWFQQWHHHSKLGFDLQADLLLAEVSDVAFFDDFDHVAPEYVDIRHLERHFTLYRPGQVWRNELLWQDYQTLDRTTAAVNRPYNRLPRLLLAGDFTPSIASIATPMSVEWVNFKRDDSVIGKRSHVVSRLGWRAERSWYFFNPELQLALTDYRLDNNVGENSIDRAVPTLGIDSGLILERTAGARGQWLQTLEPRLYFLHTPFEDQDSIPDFDTAPLTSTYDNFFRNNRFTGADRIGDASQVTFGLASRIFSSDSGYELMHARTGQIYYFEDRRVSLDGSRDVASRSDVITEVDIWPYPELKIATRLVYDQARNKLDQRDLAINYQQGGFAANLGYYFTENEIEQALVSMVYPLNERWTLVAKLHHSLIFDQPVDNLLGLAYESCCWGIKILASQSGEEIDDFAETDNRIYFEITLKGLSAAGQDIDAQLGQAIPGYRPPF